MDVIMQSVLEVILLLVFFSAYTFAVGTVLPKLFLKLEYTAGGPTDRGLRKYVYPEGRGILYEPRPATRKHVKLYILFVKDGVKYIKCRLADSVSFFGYAAVVFDNQNKVIDIIKVNDTVLADGTSRSIMLPKETSYVSFVLYSVNGKKLVMKDPFRFDAVKKRIFTVSVTAATAVMALLLRSAVFAVLDIIALNNQLVEININAFATLLVGVGAGILAARAAIRKNWNKIAG